MEVIIGKNQKFINENNDNEEMSPRRKKRKLLINTNPKNNKNIKKENKEKENYYLSNNNIYLIEKQKSELRKDKKIKFLFDDKKLDVGKITEYKLSKRKINPKKIVMIEKQKYPKKETVFYRLKGSIKETKKENNNEDTISIKKKHKKSEFMKPKKTLSKSIKAPDIKYKSNEIVISNNKK